MNKYWFKRKENGFLWEPLSWKGWLIILLFGIIMVSDFMLIDSRSHSVSDTLINFVPFAVILIITLFFICWLTSERSQL